MHRTTDGGMSTRLTFASFTDRKFRGSLRRIEAEAHALGVFESVFTFDETDLDPGFWNRHRTYCLNNPRLIGFCIWKPQAVLTALDRMEPGSVLLYCDAGCSLNPEGVDRLREYVELTLAHPTQLMGFHGGFPEAAWTKMDLLAHTGFDSPDDLASAQVFGGIFLVTKTPENEAFVRRWGELVLEPHLVDDSPSAVPNHELFREHRHDQSVFSILFKQRGGLAMQDETYWHNAWTAHQRFPIHARRWKHFFAASRESIEARGRLTWSAEAVVRFALTRSPLRFAFYRRARNS